MTRLLITLIFTVLGNFGHILNVQTAIAAEFPPSIVREQAIHERLQKSYIAKGKEYTFRSQYKLGVQPKYVNRLIEEVSPYLLQHAHNPVEWFPWSSETLDLARAENKPIFLSVGYATCHWCHVMERESFDQEDVAKVLNENFISIKIDREQHPDIDQLYLTATQLQQGQGGWPNTLWLTPDGKPFHTGTYLTKEDLIRTSMILAEGWRSPSARSEIFAVANGLSNQVMQIVGGGQAASVAVGPVLYEEALNGLLDKFNDLEGGFSEANQFPQESYLLFLLDHWRRGGPEEALDAVVITLDAIVAGGIHDHVGGGFHRYAIDPGWHTPHFEKMLYNQALLSRVFLESWEVTAKRSYRRAIERTLQYVMRDMTATNGAFYAAEDADSLNADNQNEEGAFYTWQPDELMTGLNNNRDLAIALGLDPNITDSEPFVLKMDVEEISNFSDLDNGLNQLLKYRSSRSKPFKDTKIIAGWNGLMIRSLASAGKAFNNYTYVDAAERAANTVWDKMWDGQHLARFHIDGITNGTGLLEDYVWLALGFVTLSDATGDLVWLDRSKRLANAAWKEFATDRGRLKQASLDGPLGPVFGAIDDATPSAESSALELFGLLVHRTGDLRYYGWSQKLADGISMMIARQPDNLSYALLANRLPLEGDSTLRQVRGNGNVKLQLTRDKLVLDIKDGWHLSAHVPGYDYLIGTKIKGADAQWPVGRKVKLGFASQKAFVYEGKLEIPVKLTSGNIALTVQACSDQICLTPEEAVFRLQLK